MVEPILKDKTECQGNREQCTNTLCPVFGTPLKKTFKDGKQRIKGCKDAAARGSTSRRKGLSKQRVARKALGVAPSHKFGDANEENWCDPYFSTEVKSGAQVRTVFTFWNKCKAQIDSGQPDFGAQSKIPRVVAMPEGTSDGIVLMRLSDWEKFIKPLVLDLQGQENE
jgi:hypothetical protein